MADDPTWSALDDDSFDDLCALAHACLEADGGMPLFVGEQMLGGRMLIGESVAARDVSGAPGSGGLGLRGRPGTITDVTPRWYQALASRPVRQCRDRRMARQPDLQKARLRRLLWIARRLAWWWSLGIRTLTSSPPSTAGELPEGHLDRRDGT